MLLQTKTTTYKITELWNVLQVSWKLRVYEREGISVLHSWCGRALNSDKCLRKSIMKLYCCKGRNKDTLSIPFLIRLAMAYHIDPWIYTLARSQSWETLSLLNPYRTIVTQLGLGDISINALISIKTYTWRHWPIKHKIASKIENK